MSTLKVTNIQHGSATNVAMVLDTAGTVKAYSTISVGNVTPSSSGAGITFPATQNASTDANTLDDYEEGTWTPTAYGGTVTGTTTYVTQRGYYVKIGKQVTINFYVAYSAMTGTGNLRVGGFPFNLIATYDAVGTLQTSNLDWGSVGQLTLYGEESNNFARIFISTDNAAWAAQQCVNESADISGSLTFYTT